MGKSFLKKLWSVEKTGSYKTINFLGLSFKMARSATMKANIYRDKVTKQYDATLTRLRKEVVDRPIRIAFILQLQQKWNCQSLYQELKKASWAEVTIVLHAETKEEALAGRGMFFQSADDNVLVADYETPLEEFDIVFYQQPWGAHANIDILNVSKYALTCYVPYCFYTCDSELNYMLGFHGLLWRYFVDSDFYIDEYKQKFGATNCASLGHPKFDQYRQLDKRPAAWKSKHKKRIIYAPHHSFSDTWGHAVATWQWNGRLLLDLAKENRETTEWIFRPHPDFYRSVIEFNKATEEEIKQYYKEWEEVGTIDTDGDYYNVFESSDCLITDCLSFLAEYLPSGHPLLHLRSERQTDPFNPLGEQIISQYYQIHNTDELVSTFKRVILDGDDWLKEKRLANVACLGIDADKTAGEKISAYLADILQVPAKIQ